MYYEARGEAAAGQQAVAQVVLNRVRHPAFPKSICGVVFQRNAEACQFSFACETHSATGREAAAWRRAQVVADQALDGFVMRQVGEATHFHVINLGVGWSQGLARVAQIGAHVFFGLTGRPERTLPTTTPSPATRPATPPPELQLAAAPIADAQRVHLVLASDPVAASAPVASSTAPAAPPVRVDAATAAAKPAEPAAPVPTTASDTH